MISVHHTTVDSTSRRAAVLAARNPGVVMLVSATTQTAGRGRSGRTWQSPEGGAWFSVAWPTTAPPQRLTPAPLVVGWAVRTAIVDALNSRLATRPRPDAIPLTLKWPNDLLLADHKVAGILCEQTVAPAAGSARRTLIVGVGINVNNDAPTLGLSARLPATSLRTALGVTLDVRDLVRQCATGIVEQLRALEASGLAPDLIERINEHLAWRGERVALRRGDERMDGQVQGVDASGQLVLRTDAGPIACTAGEVEALRPQEAMRGSPWLLTTSSRD